MARQTSSALHAYNPPQFDDVRSPCPALNALANHSYIPHNGKNITFIASVRALCEVYHLSWLLAIILTLAGCFCSKRLAFDLSDLRIHGAIEHDGSLSRGDAVPNSQLAPCDPDPARLNSLLSTSDGKDLTLDDLCKVRRMRDKALRTPLSKIHDEIARGEIALAYALFASNKDGKVQVQHFRTWFGGDRLPEGWTPPAVQQGLFATRAVSQEVAKKVAVLAKSE
ncbi:Cloroperoxidase [Exidia glandulosa HHB12029]|uniref:Cloroperoxidase n=1 Tax=Exidia glandulosa HHB12029 TaxID=1314781 RepID=A0A165EM52_EXIGL|nr:Cloroperoxidase [Exidia glandulosa HHB12029]